jgi:hypothetical protein
MDIHTVEVSDGLDWNFAESDLDKMLALKKGLFGNLLLKPSVSTTVGLVPFIPRSHKVISCYQIIWLFYVAFAFYTFVEIMWKFHRSGSTEGGFDVYKARVDIKPIGVGEEIGSCAFRT